MLFKLEASRYIDDIVCLEFVWLALKTIRTESFAVVECPIGVLDVLDEGLQQTLNILYFVKRYSSNAPLVLLPDPSMMLTQNLRVKVWLK